MCNKSFSAQKVALKRGELHGKKCIVSVMTWLEMAYKSKKKKKKKKS